MSRLRSFVYVSTYYVNNFMPHNAHVKEEVHRGLPLTLTGEKREREALPGARGRGDNVSMILLESSWVIRSVLGGRGHCIICRVLMQAPHHRVGGGAPLGVFLSWDGDTIPNSDAVDASLAWHLSTGSLFAS